MKELWNAVNDGSKPCRDEHVPIYHSSYMCYDVDRGDLPALPLLGYDA